MQLQPETNNVQGRKRNERRESSEENNQTPTGELGAQCEESRSFEGFTKQRGRTGSTLFIHRRKPLKRWKISTGPGSVCSKWRVGPRVNIRRRTETSMVSRPQRGSGKSVGTCPSLTANKIKTRYCTAHCTKDANY